MSSSAWSAPSEPGCPAGTQTVKSARGDAFGAPREIAAPYLALATAVMPFSNRLNPSTQSALDGCNAPDGVAQRPSRVLFVKSARSLRCGTGTSPMGSTSTTETISSGTVPGGFCLRPRQLQDAVCGRKVVRESFCP